MIRKRQDETEKAGYKGGNNLLKREITIDNKAV